MCSPSGRKAGATTQEERRSSHDGWASHFARRFRQRRPRARPRTATQRSRRLIERVNPNASDEASLAGDRCTTRRSKATLRLPTGCSRPARSIAFDKHGEIPVTRACYCTRQDGIGQGNAGSAGCDRSHPREGDERVQFAVGGLQPQVYTRGQVPRALWQIQHRINPVARKRPESSSGCGLPPDLEEPTQYSTGYLYRVLAPEFSLPEQQEGNCPTVAV